MPIEYCYRYRNIEEGGIVPVGQEVEFGHKHIDPTDAVPFFDYSRGKEDPDELIIITCKEQDDGAIIYSLAPEPPFDSGDLDGLTEQDLPEEVIAHEIDGKIPTEIELTLEDGTDMVLIARYTPPDEISDSMIIPTGLMYPN